MKYYWIAVHVKSFAGDFIENYVTIRHPFEWIKDESQIQEMTKRLINWREITIEDYVLYKKTEQ